MSSRRYRFARLPALWWILTLVNPASAQSAATPPASILVGRDAAPRVRFAAREVQRYVYLRTGALLAIATADAPPIGAAIVVTQRGGTLAAPPDEIAPPTDSGAYVLRSVAVAGAP